jgi:hypothetical protein
MESWKVGVVMGWVMGVVPVQGQVLTEDPLYAAMVRLYGGPAISANPIPMNSTSNDVGPWGSDTFLYSWNNDVGPLGSPVILTSLTSELGTGRRIRFSEETLARTPGLRAAVKLYGDPVLSANPYLLNSTSNDVGPWGSDTFLYSFNNEVGPLGSPVFLDSVSNELGTGVKVELLEAEFYPEVP